MAGAVQGETVMQLINFVAAGQWQAIKSATAASCEPLVVIIFDSYRSYIKASHNDKKWEK